MNLFNVFIFVFVIKTLKTAAKHLLVDIQRYEVFKSEQNKNF